jgi:cation diffusion facilitator CzcD-associated flavoprotein CzcO
MPITRSDLRHGAEAWLRSFEEALQARDPEALKVLFLDESYLRDNGALTWDFRQFHGRSAVINTLLMLAEEIQPHDLRIADDWPAPSLIEGKGDPVVEAFFEFETASGAAVGLLNGVPDSASPYRFTVKSLYTRLESLLGVDEPEVHPRGSGYAPRHAGETWAQHRDHERQYVETEPEVLIVGAGQAGLVAAAFLRQLDVSTLVIDKHERVGDNWRTRYEALTLHNPVEMNGFPFLPFPRHYPQYLPKDMVGEWLETYSRYLDLNVWTSTEFREARYDDAAGRWGAVLGRADGTERVLHPRHIIHATGGIGGKPATPELPGLASFSGEVMHSHTYRSAVDHAGVQRAIVVGTGTSAHDVSVDLHDHGVEVTMVQRGPTIVADIDTATLAYSGYLDPDQSTALVDIRYGVGLINPLREVASRKYWDMAKELNADLHTNLESAGMRLHDGFNGQGHLDWFLRKGGGFYHDKGASAVIVAGGIKIQQADRIVEFVEDGAKLDDGTLLEADLLILATGYRNRQVEIAEQFGEEVAERVGPIAQLNDEGEWAAMWCQSGQPGLWITGGGINQIRPGCRVLSLLVKADIDGRIPESFRRPPANSDARPGFLSTLGVD